MAVRLRTAGRFDSGLIIEDVVIEVMNGSDGLVEIKKVAFDVIHGGNGWRAPIHEDLPVTVDPGRSVDLVIDGKARHSIAATAGSVSPDPRIRVDVILGSGAHRRSDAIAVRAPRPSYDSGGGGAGSDWQ